MTNKFRQNDVKNDLNYKKIAEIIKFTFLTINFKANIIK